MRLLLLTSIRLCQVGDIVHAGAAYGKVRTMFDDMGKAVYNAGPSIAVQLIGLNATPQVGKFCALTVIYMHFESIKLCVFA